MNPTRSQPHNPSKPLSTRARSVLVANNGLAAVKFMRSIRSWAYQARALL